MKREQYWNSCWTRWISESNIKTAKRWKIKRRNGREYVVKNHSWEAVARKVAEVCENAVREHKNKK